ncbi:MAG: cellulase family glycosylhydrolase [Thermoleophilaceae bacterium]
MARTRGLAALVGVAAIAFAPGAAAAPQAPFGHAGRWITDSQGRVVVFHGVNVVHKHPPYQPAAYGFGEDDAVFLRHEGFNSARLGIIYKGLEPQRGQFDDGYLQAIADTAGVLEREGVFPLVDFHQDQYNERFDGQGFPDWAVMDDGLPNEPDNGFPGNYLTMPALWRAFDHFWANDGGLQDDYAAAWKHAAEGLRPDPFLIGFDIFNEPWPGSQWQTCAQPAGCPQWDEGPLAEFNKRTFAAIRGVDDRRLLFYETHPLFNAGAQEYVPDTGDQRAGFSFHLYCLGATPGVPQAPGGDEGKESGCPYGEQRVFDGAETQSQKTGDALLLTEFGATDDLSDIQRVVDEADKAKVSWEYWAWWNRDVCCERPNEGVIKDPSKPPTPDNVKQDKLGVLVRPYPSVTAGTPAKWSFDTTSKAFGLEYVAGRADKKGAFPPGSQTEITVPQRVYPTGYNVAVDGARVASSPGAPVVTLHSLNGADRIKVGITPAKSGTGAVLGVKRPYIRLTVKPKRVRAGQRVRFTFTAVSLSGGTRRPLRAVHIWFAHRRATTNRRGKAVIRIALRRGRTGVKASKRGYVSGRAVVRVSAR